MRFTIRFLNKYKEIRKSLKGRDQKGKIVKVREISKDK
jgi:hypothetical protein